MTDHAKVHGKDDLVCFHPQKIPHTTGVCLVEHCIGSNPKVLDETDDFCAVLTNYKRGYPVIAHFYRGRIFNLSFDPFNEHWKEPFDRLVLLESFFADSLTWFDGTWQKKTDGWCAPAPYKGGEDGGDVGPMLLSTYADRIWDQLKICRLLQHEADILSEVSFLFVYVS